jgi:protein dithiol oxidoreductase (disulfide-forming)
MSLRNLLAGLAAILSFAAGTASAQTNYGIVTPAQPTEGGGKIEVLEFFWYGCPHCYHLEPSVNTFANNVPKDVVFKRVPAVPSDGWGEHAKIFYTLETMNLLDKYHQKVFEAIQTEHVNLGNKKFRDEWLAKNGIDPAKYAEVEKSFSVATKMQRAKQLTYAYKVDSVPRLFVNGQYSVTAEQAGGPDKVFGVVDQLVAMVRKTGK